MSIYRAAIDCTADTINRRAQFFRNQVVIVSAVGILPLVGAIALHSWTILGAWLLAVPAAGFFFAVDSHIVNAWEGTILATWTSGELHLGAWLPAIRANPVLPKNTLEGMLSTLPVVPALAREQQIKPATRRAIAAAAIAFHQTKSDHLLINATASLVIVSTLLAALWSQRWLPLLGSAVLVLMPLARLSSARRRRAAASEEHERSRLEPDFDESQYAQLVSPLA